MKKGTHRKINCSRLPHVDDLRTPPVIGELYRVRCVNLKITRGFYRESGQRVVRAETVWIPVIGTLHSDPEIGGVAAHPHVHYDWRFMSPRFIYGISQTWLGDEETDDAKLRRLMALVRSEYPANRLGTGPNSNRSRFPIRLKNCIRMCHRAMPEYPARRRDYVYWEPADSEAQNRPNVVSSRLESCYLGHKLDLSTMVCPHRGTYLGNLAPNAEGYIVCPNHGLCWDAVTGGLVPRYSKEERDSVLQRLPLNTTSNEERVCTK